MFGLGVLPWRRPVVRPAFFDGNVLETVLASLMDGHVVYKLGKVGYLLDSGNPKI